MALRYRDSLYNNYFSNVRSETASLEHALRQRQYYNDYFLKRFLPADASIQILEIGCGYGTILASLKDLGYTNFLGIDTSDEAIELLKQTEFSSHIVKAEIVQFLEDAVYQNRAWDAVIAIDVLEHFTKDELVYILGLLEKVLSPSGQLIIKVPNLQSPALAGAISFGDFTHEMHFTPRSLTQVLNACGFHQVKAYEAAPVPYTAASFIRHCLWRIMRQLYTLLYAIELGHFDRSLVWTCSFFAVARK